MATVHKHALALRVNAQVRIAEITPRIAKNWLECNSSNRKVRPSHVKKLSTAMAHGQWDNLNGDTIRFDSNGDLIDGQHRLLAVIESGVTIKSFVALGISPQAKGSIDTGAMRSLGDFINSKGHRSGRNLAATLIFLRCHELKVYSRYGRSHSPFHSYDEAEEFLLAHKEIENSVNASQPLKPFLIPSQAAVLDYLFREKDIELYKAWWLTMATGTKVSDHEVFFDLRERLIRDRLKKGQRPRLEGFVYNIKAWNAARNGHTIKIFKWSDAEEVPEIL